jgi:L-lactate dehydrogenase complex protein LldF
LPVACIGKEKTNASIIWLKFWQIPIETMSSPRVFRERIRQAMDNPVLQAALDANAERRLKGRALAFASLPDWRERRQRAHALRATVIADLERYLAQFIGQLETNGISVHRAANALEAQQIVLEIVAAAAKKNPPAALVAKSKSMVSEEIELNHALQSAGHRVVETDLGEYIVQLRGERPSHIITPAVHLRRQEVAALFQQKLGIPYSEEISTLTNTARQVLRQVFLEADVGISGVNFGVAATGGLCIVTNEGNGRMVTTLPPVHIALMGIERLVPTLDDLALFLSLLPRSATGQKLSVYTQILHRPLRGQQRHVILVDNGRRAMQASPLREALSCIRCGACLNACPVFREIGGHAYVGRDGAIAPYPGPIGSIVSPGLLGSNFAHLAQASSLCGACREACPVDIDLPLLLTRVRAGMGEEGMHAPEADRGEGLSLPVRWGLRLYARLARDPRWFAVSQRVAWLMAVLVSPFSGWVRLPAFTGWGLSKDFPRPAARSFRRRWAAVQQEQRGATAMPPARRLQEEKPPLASSSVTAPDLVEQFRQELIALGGQVICCRREEMPARLIDFLRQKGISRVQLTESVPGVAGADLTEAGVEVCGEADAQVRAGITPAVAGIAESGSLLLSADPKDALLASLLPSLHVVVMNASQLVGTLAEALRRREVRQAAASVIITGPSRTADIEMTLTIGVHGPGEVCVFLIDDLQSQ